MRVNRSGSTQPPPTRANGRSESAATPESKDASKAHALRVGADGFESKGKRDAVAFVRAFDRALPIDAKQLREREANMAQSPIEFFNANPSLFFADVKADSGAKLLGRSAPQVTVAGDAHLHNFGTSRGADGHPVWGINDFDQAGKGSPEVDLLRLSGSIALAARGLGATPAQEAKLLEKTASAYADEVKRLAAGGSASASSTSSLSADEAKGPVSKLIAKADDAGRKDFLKKWTKGLDKGKPRFEDNPELKKVGDGTQKKLEAALAGYGKVLDVAQKLGSGGSSYGLERYYALVEDPKHPKKPVILEVKQLLPVTLDDQTPDLSRADPAAVKKRALELGADLNPLTGGATIDGKKFLIRELEPEKGKIDVAKDLSNVSDLEALATQAAEVLARAHAHGGAAKSLAKWIGSDADKLGTSLAAEGSRYATQAEADHKAFVASVRS